MDIDFDDFDEGARERGTCCNLCCRRFHINKQFTESFGIIDAQNKALMMAQLQSESEIKALEKERLDQEKRLLNQQVQVESVELDSESYQTTVFKYQAECEQSESDKEYLDERVAQRLKMLD